MNVRAYAYCSIVMMVDVFTPEVLVLVVGFHNRNQMGVIIMIGQRMVSSKNEDGELHCSLIEVLLLAILHICNILVGGCDAYNLDINVFLIGLILDGIF